MTESKYHPEEQHVAARTGGGGGGSCLSTCFCLLVLAGIGGGLAWYFTKGGGEVPHSLGDLKNMLPDLSDFHKEQPFDGSTPEEVPSWAHEPGMLNLDVVSAVDDTWYPYFVQALDDWENGSPDVLTLTLSTMEYDASCTPIDGLMKVCNHDFGDSGWYGINEAMVMQQEIVSSVAKMNDFYFTSAMEARRQYTMCHEVGHGFGLAHTDETFWNKDLGNCMDYTNTPENNLHPDATNFEFLNALYGTSGGQSTTDDATGATTTTTTATDDAAVTTATEDDDGAAAATGGGRQRRRLLPDWVKEKWSKVSAAAAAETTTTTALSSSKNNHPAHWRLLHSNEYEETHRVELGEGYAVIVQKRLYNGERL